MLIELQETEIHTRNVNREMHKRDVQGTTKEDVISELIFYEIYQSESTSNTSTNLYLNPEI